MACVSGRGDRSARVARRNRRVLLVIHLTFLTGFKNRVSALFHWTISFFGRSRPERTITAQQIFARQALTASGRNGARRDLRAPCSHEIHLTREGGEANARESRA